MKLLDRRLIVVTGKGGVGKTTVSAALALAAARTGRRVCVCELNGTARIQALFGKPRAYGPIPLGDVAGLHAMSLHPQDCLDDFGRRKLKMDALVRALLANRVTTAFIDAVPGLHDLLQLGKIENMLMDPLAGDTHYDLVVLDAPATGHGLTMLAAARALTETTRVGPFHDLAQVIEVLLEDPRKSAICAVTLPEDLPVSETLDLVDRLGDEASHLRLVVANQVHPPSLPTDPPWGQVRADLLASVHPEIRELAALGDGARERDAGQRDALEVLRTGLDRNLPTASIVELPRIDAEELGRNHIASLADRLGAHLDGVS